MPELDDRIVFPERYVERHRDRVDDPARSASLCEIANLAQLEVEVDVPERNILKVRPGLDCVLTPDADPEKTYRGFVDRVMPIADDSKNVIKVRIRVILPKGKDGGKDEVPGAFLKPKMSVSVNAYNRESR